MHNSWSMLWKFLINSNTFLWHYTEITMGRSLDEKDLHLEMKCASGTIIGQHLLGLRIQSVNIVPSICLLSIKSSHNEWTTDSNEEQLIVMGLQCWHVLKSLHNSSQHSDIYFTIIISAISSQDRMVRLDRELNHTTEIHAFYFENHWLHYYSNCIGSFVNFGHSI